MFKYSVCTHTEYGKSIAMEDVIMKSTYFIQEDKDS